MPEHIWWYLSRSSGMVTLGASGASVIWGLLISTRLIRRRSAGKWLLDLHRFLGALTVVGLAVHVGSILADSFVSFTPADVLVPGHSVWRPLAVAWGVVAMYLLVAVQVTSFFRRRLPARWWRGIHKASFGALVASIVHAATAGSDTSNRAYVVVALLVSGVVVFLTVIRLMAGRLATTRPLRPTGS